ncbi:unnamed protein product [Phytophthora fragariaefolia]|uniref:Unnamed protein product n=1 Tax=Phytophthora fragariaefolia TaxID=1490495 RepID=A0A9W6Y6C8_9STRA|nr:unnamed protein product [Phytophthora fragariaefolia]
MGRGAPLRPADPLASSEASRSSPKTYPSASKSSYSFTSSSLASEIPPADSSKPTDLSEIDERRPPLPVRGVGPPSISIRPDVIGVAGTAEDPLAIFVFFLLSSCFFSSSSSPKLVRATGNAETPVVEPPRLALKMKYWASHSGMQGQTLADSELGARSIGNNGNNAAANTIDATLADDAALTSQSKKHKTIADGFELA